MKDSVRRLARAVIPVVAVLVVALVFSVFTARQYAFALPLTKVGGGPFDPAADNSVQVTVNGTPVAPCTECASQAITVNYNPSTGAWSVTKNDNNANSTGTYTGSSHDANTTPTTTSTSTPPGTQTQTTSAQGNVSGSDSGARSTANGMRIAVQDTYPLQSSKNAVTSSFSIVIEWSGACQGGGGGSCKYKVTLTVTQSNSGAVTGADAS